MLLDNRDASISWSSTLTPLRCPSCRVAFALLWFRPLGALFWHIAFWRVTQAHAHHFAAPRGVFPAELLSLSSALVTLATFFAVRHGRQHAFFLVTAPLALVATVASCLAWAPYFRFTAIAATALVLFPLLRTARLRRALFCVLAAAFALIVSQGILITASSLAAPNFLNTTIFWPPSLLIAILASNSMQRRMLPAERITSG